LHSHRFYAGTELNLDKSDGITLLSNERSSELRSKKSFSFLGHEIGLEDIGLANKTKNKIKTKISRIIHRHLLLYPKRLDQMSPYRVDLNSRIDWDLVTCINELRSYINGSLTDGQIEGTESVAADNEVTGVVAFFSSVNNGSVFRELDGWLVNVLRRALSERRRRLWQYFEIQTPMVARHELIEGSWYNHELKNNTRLPSLFDAWKAARRVMVSKATFSQGVSPYAYG